jgi:hypothetical protein
MTFVEQADHLAMECEQLLDEGAPVMQEGHLESAQVVCHIGPPTLLKELSDKGGDRDDLARECPALHPWL